MACPFISGRKYDILGHYEGDSWERGLVYDDTVGNYHIFLKPDGVDESGNPHDAQRVFFAVGWVRKAIEEPGVLEPQVPPPAEATTEEESDPDDQPDV